MKILIRDLIYTGVHGLTEKEKNIPQRFKVDIVIEPWRTLVKEEILEENIDYRESKKIVQEIIEGPHHDLIETIGNKIADRLIKNPNILSLTVTVSKLDIWDNGIPSVRIIRNALPKTNLLDFDLHKVIQDLLLYGGTSFPILSEEKRRLLVTEAEQYEYIKKPEIVGKNKVREQLSAFGQFPEGSLFLKLQEDFTELLNYKLSLSPLKPFGNTPIQFNEPILQKYDKNSIGITPHVDGLSCLNLILVFLLKGTGDVILCSDRKGANPRFLDTTLGNMTILRAPGFFGSPKRPFHYLTNIPEERITFGLRLNKKLL